MKDLAGKTALLTGANAVWAFTSQERWHKSR